MESNQKSAAALSGLAGLLASIMGPQEKVNIATQYWLNRFKEAVVARRPSIVNEGPPNAEIMEELSETHLDPVKAAREYLLRVFGQQRAADDTVDLDPFGDTSKMTPKDRATVTAMQIMWDNDFLVSLKETIPAFGEKFVKDFDWTYIAALHKQLLSPQEAARTYIAEKHPDLARPNNDG